MQNQFYKALSFAVGPHSVICYYYRSDMDLELKKIEGDAFPVSKDGGGGGWWVSLFISTGKCDVGFNIIINRFND